jgi:hypothetical protein
LEQGLNNQHLYISSQYLILLCPLEACLHNAL